MSALIKSFRVFLAILNSTSRARRLRIYVFAAVVSVLAVFDVVALGLLALTLSPMVSGSDVKIPGFGVVASGFVPVLLALIVPLMLSKNLLTLVMYRTAIGQVERLEVEVSAEVFERYVRKPWVLRADLQSTDVIRLSEYSVMRATWLFVLPFATLPSLFVTVSVLAVALAIVQPLSALLTVTFFGAVGVLMHRFMSPRSREAGISEVESRNSLNSRMLEMLNASKEIAVQGRIDDAIEGLEEPRRRAAAAYAKYTFLSNISRPFLEMALLGGALIVAGVNFFVGGPVAAISSVAIFGLAGFRLAPAISAIQTNLVALSVGAPFAADVAACLAEDDPEVEWKSAHSAPPETLSIELIDVRFRYPGAESNALEGISLNIPQGSRTAFVGPSGAGKSTLADLLLGLLPPTGGEIRVGGVPLLDCLPDWQREIGYVPQQISLFSGSIAQNVALTWDNDFDNSAVLHALSRAQLSDLVAKLPEGIHTEIGENGWSLSGGQRQRLGIARALYRDPKVLILDEATSALDNKTESDISSILYAMGESLTVIAIAHRLSTIAAFDSIVYLSNGVIQASGPFEEVVRQSPEFANQARLAGLVGFRHTETEGK